MDNRHDPSEVTYLTSNSVNSSLPDDDVIDLLALARVLWSRIIWIILVATLCGGIMGAYNKLILKPTYSADAKIYISNSDSVVNLQSIQISAALAQDYADIMTSRGVLKKVISDQSLDMTYVQLGKMIKITNPKDTHILKVSVTSNSPELSIRIANSLLKFGIDTIFKTVGNDEPSVIDFAEADAISINKTSFTKHVLMGAIMGTMVICGVFVLLFLLDNTVHTEEDVKDYGLPVLAEIPEYDDEIVAKGRKKNVRK